MAIRAPGMTERSGVWRSNGLGYEQLGILSTTVQFSKEFCFMFVLWFYHFHPNCL